MGDGVRNTIKDVWSTKSEKIPEGICCVCHHMLSSHIYEDGKGWRCHQLGLDGYQCECWLRDECLEDDGETPNERRTFYDLKKRRAEAEKDE